MARSLLFSKSMLNRDKIIAAFQQALNELNDGSKTLRPRTVAVRAHEIYRSNLGSDQKPSSWETFRRFTHGPLAIPEVVELLKGANILSTTPARLDRQKLREVFQEAIQRMEDRLLRGQAKPLQIARRAYVIYTKDQDESVTQPSHHTFERLIYGKTADPEIRTLIETALTKSRKD